MATAPSVHNSSLIPPFVYRIPIRAIDFAPTERDSWQSNYDIKLRLRNIRQFIAARLSADEFLADRSRESQDTIQELTDRCNGIESGFFASTHDASAYQCQMMGGADLIGIHWRPERVPNLTELSFRAVWRQMAVEEQEEFALQSNSTDAVRDLCRFVYQKTRTISEMRSNLKDS